MFQIAVNMLAANRTRFVVTTAAIGALFFLSAAQIGLLVGWCGTTSAIIRHADADLWIMAPHTPAFDYGTAIPAMRVQQARSVPGVAWAEGMFMAWNTWKTGTGRHVNIELIGLDDSCVGGPWAMVAGTPDAVHQPDGVIVDELFAAQLGVDALGNSFDLYGERAVVRGISRDVRTFTASPFVFTSIERARSFDKRYRDDEMTYVLVRCEAAANPAEVQAAIRAELPGIECLTRDEFVLRTVTYWMLETGIGITVVLTALLGFIVSAVVTSQTLYTLAQDHREHFATLLALGFKRAKLAGIVLQQSGLFGLLGIAAGSILFVMAAQASASTPIPIETTPLVFVATAGTALLTCLAASFLAVRTLWKLDPADVFRA